MCVYDDVYVCVHVRIQIYIHCKYSICIHVYKYTEVGTKLLTNEERHVSDHSGITVT